MSTRSRIGILHADGSIDAHYCHSDGYFDHNGRILHEHYQDVAKIQELIDLGDMSVLGPEIGEKHDFEWMSQEYFSKGDHSGYANDPRGKMCLFYNRDRGENVGPPAHYSGLLAFGADFEEYAYLWVEAGGLLDRRADL